MAHFRFQGLRIWKEAIAVGNELFDIAEKLRENHYYRFADQLFGAGMGIANNISESTGTKKIGEQQQLLRYSKREAFEAANILIILNQRNLFASEEELNALLGRLDLLCRGIMNYSRSLDQ